MLSNQQGFNDCSVRVLCEGGSRALHRIDGDIARKCCMGKELKIESYTLDVGKKLWFDRMRMGRPALFPLISTLTPVLTNWFSSITSETSNRCHKSIVLT